MSNKKVFSVSEVLSTEEICNIAMQAQLQAEHQEALRKSKETRGGALQRQLAEFEEFSKLGRSEKHQYQSQRMQSERVMHQQQMDLIRQESIKQLEQAEWISAV